MLNLDVLIGTMCSAKIRIPIYANFCHRGYILAGEFCVPLSYSMYYRNHDAGDTYEVDVLTRGGIYQIFTGYENLRFRLLKIEKTS